MQTQEKMLAENVVSQHFKCCKSMFQKYVDCQRVNNQHIFDISKYMVHVRLAEKLNDS